MGNKNHLYIIRINAIPIHPNEAGSPAVDQELTMAAFNENAALKPASAPKSVTTAEKLDLNMTHAVSP
ncbi:MAG: hypothetical protein ABSG75_14180 [Syntrophales bacterium]